MYPRREEALRADTKLSARQINRIIERETFVRSEIVKFEVELNEQASPPEITFTLK